jgi:small-conductance mechanosensitive channel
VFSELARTAGEYSSALIALSVWFLGGLVVDVTLFRVVSGRAKARGWAAGDALARGLQGFPAAAALVVGANQAIGHLGPSPAAQANARSWIQVAGILLVTAFASRIGGRMIRAYTQREDARLPSSSIFVNLARTLIWVIGVTTVLAARGVSIAPLLTALGVGGLAIGLALQPTLENFFSGIQVLMSKQVLPGDFVQLETGQQGWVQDVTWRNTTLKLMSNDLVIVPNATIGKSLVTNYSTLDEQTVIWLNLGVDYSSDLGQVERATLEVAREVGAQVEGAVPGYEPLFRFTEFGDSAVRLTVSVQAESAHTRPVVRHEFIKRLKARYDAEGIVIPLPQHTVHLVSAEETAPA